MLVIVASSYFDVLVPGTLFLLYIARPAVFRI